MSTDARRTLGQLGEDLAAAHFRRLGFEVLDRNFRTRLGELDLVASDGTVLVFCEVKTRRAGSGHPWDSLHARKQDRVRRMAALWLQSRRERPYFPSIRFDAVGVVLDAGGALVSLVHEERAF
jgi:putative endonuclease